MPIDKPETFRQIKEHFPDLYSQLREMNDVFQFKAVGIKTEKGAWWFGEFDPPKDLTVKLTNRRW